MSELKNKAHTKKAQALKVINRMQRRKHPPTRQKILETLESEVHLTPSGAATYYQNIVHGNWAS